MRFWDSSAIIPLIVNEASSAKVMRLLKEDRMIAVWWGTLVECRSALSRIRREGLFTSKEEAHAVQLLLQLENSWTELMPCDSLRDNAVRLLNLHSLRAADALQLSAALQWAGGPPAGCEFVCLDDRLSEAAVKEGFIVMPR